MSKIAVFPGSFDPITKGHESIIKRAIPLFDKIIVAIGVHTTKQPLLKSESRVIMVNRVFRDYENVTADSFRGLKEEPT